MQGYAKRWMFPNGLGVSIVHHEGSMGNDKGYFECALFTHKNKDNAGLFANVVEMSIVDVVGYIPFPAVNEILLYVYQIPQDLADDIMDHQEHVERNDVFSVKRRVDGAVSKITDIRETYRISRWQDRLHAYAEKGDLTR